MQSEAFVRNQWYVVASTDEITTTPLARTVCGEHVVLYRRTDGTPVALPDRCSHKGFPLSLGQVIDDELQCGYHGLRFDSCGTCTWAPSQDRIPSKANIGSYPLTVTGPWVWIWIGDPDQAGDLPDPLMWLDDPAWTVANGMEPLAAGHGLLIDNLLDLSHETFLHAGYIGTPEVADTPIETTVDDARAVVRVSRHMEGVECPPFYERTTGYTTPIDRWQDIEYHPVCCYILHIRVAPAGTEPAADGSDPNAAHVKVLYGITPVDAGNTMDFWAVCRDFALDDDAATEVISEMNRTVVLQDVTALEALHKRLSAEPEQNEVSLKIDTGALAARRMVRQLVDAQS